MGRENKGRRAFTAGKEKVGDEQNRTHGNWTRSFGKENNHGAIPKQRSDAIEHILLSKHDLAVESVKVSLAVKTGLRNPHTPPCFDGRIKIFVRQLLTSFVWDVCIRFQLQTPVHVINITKHKNISTLTPCYCIV